MACPAAKQITVVDQKHPLVAKLLTPQCLEFLATLQRAHNSTRKMLLEERVKRAILLDKGMPMTYPAETYAIRQANWTVAPVPKELQKRWIEITGPPSKKGCINAMNSGADVWMADFEDALAPTWDNLLSGQQNLIETNARTLTFKEGPREYKFNENVATLLVRPRGWHLEEKHVLVDNEPMSGSLFDFGVYFFHNYELRKQKGLGGCFYYLPKMEAYQEARLWNDVFLTAQKLLNAPVGTIRCTVLIETIGGSLAMDEILFELKEHIVALNAGRWDYIFSIIKKLKARKDSILPDRSQVTMTVPFMKAYTERLIHTCHKRGAHAIGGMSAFIPSKTDTKFNEQVFKKILADKELEANSGCDGSWVAHPGLVQVARSVFERKLGNKEHQKDVLRPEVNVRDFELTDLRIPGSSVSEAGVRNNINVCIQYIYHWLNGAAAVGIHNLMEDAATAEISRSQLWQWVRYRVKTNCGKLVDERMYAAIRDEEVTLLRPQFENKEFFEKAVQLTDELVLSDGFAEFLTLPAYDWLVAREVKPKL